MASLTASRPGSGYYKALSIVDLYEFQTESVTNTSYLQLHDSSLPQDVCHLEILVSQYIVFSLKVHSLH